MGVLEQSTREALYAAQDENTRLRARVAELGVSLTKHNESVNVMAREVVRKDDELATLRTRVAELERNELQYIEQLQEQNNRLATLEAPPVVPERLKVPNAK